MVIRTTFFVVSVRGGERRGERNPDLATCKSTTSRIGGIDIEREEGDSKFQIHDLQPDALL